MKVLTYRISLLEPLLATAIEGDPNSGVAFSYLPGSVLRGMVIANYLRTNRLTTSPFDAADPDLRRLFFDGTTRYLNGYPVDRLTDKRTLPTPLSWQQDKEEVGKETLQKPAPVFDFAVEPRAAENKQWQGVEKPFCILTNDTVRLVQPDRHIAVHTARDRKYGRARSGSGAVYRYDALAAGQTYEAAILVDDNDAANIKSLVTGEAVLGGSRSSGYGRVMLEVIRDEAANGWREVGVPLTPSADGLLIITMLSSVLLRDANGQFVVDADTMTMALAAALGQVELNPIKDRIFLRGEPVGGFNRKWGLPLPQALAMQKGSVFVFEKPDCPNDKLRQLELEGIGERRAEGFGRVAVNWHTEGTMSIDTAKPSPPPAQALVSATAGEKLAHRMVERMLRRRLDELLVESANKIMINNPPSGAQISRLRNIIQDELMKDAPSLQRVGQFLQSVNQRGTARKQFERARIVAEPLSNWLDQACERTGEDEWKTLLRFKAEDTRSVGNVQSTLTETLRTEYLLRFIDAVLARAAKSRRKTGE